MPEVVGLDSPKFENVPVIVYSHSKEPKATFKHALLRGFAGYDGKNQLNLYPPSTFSTGTYTVDVYALAHGWIDVDPRAISASEILKTSL